jgi:two-component system chemotaxis sensor kinase CheA
MVDGGGPETIVALRSLGDEARKEDAGPCIQVIDDLIAKLEEDLQRGLDHLLKVGVGQLQASYEFSGEAPAKKVTRVPLGEDAELVGDFVVEAREHLSDIEGQMLSLERDPSDMEVLHAVFRAFHTIKGLAGFLDFAVVQTVAHEVETLLDLARNEKLVIHPSIVDVVLESGDFILGELGAIERALNSGTLVETADPDALAAKIRQLAVPQGSQPKEAQPAPRVEVPAKRSVESISAGKPAPEPEVLFPEVPASETVAAKRVSAAVPVEAANNAQSAPSQAAAPGAPPAGRSFETPDGKGFIKLFSAEDRAAMIAASAPVAAPPAEPQKPVAPAPVAAGEAAQSPASASRTGAAKEPARPADAGSVRVETAKLDHLMDMVGEIVIAQSLIRHNPAFATTTDSRLLGDLAQLARVTGEVQRATMSMRMIPVSHVFQRVERVIRDLSRKAGKHVILETVGSETELDKTVAEELSDPLLHMVRNSVDHGIEKAEERIAAGKPAEARIRLSARHQGGLVIIAISDDGRGLNSERIRSKAEERGLIAPNTQLTETEVYNLIFEPGFSTAEKITDVSGRGVGMDVVRRNVEKLRGRIDTESTPGQGTTFSLKLPLTLAIIDGLVVEVGSDRYIVPLSCVREMFRPQNDALFTVEGRDEMLLVRGKLLPVVRLNQRLGIYGMASKPSEGLIVVVESHNRCFCMLVDDLLGKQEVVIKSLGEALKNIPGLSGCAVLGDGRVGLILDIDGIFRGNR